MPTPAELGIPEGSKFSIAAVHAVTLNLPQRIELGEGAFVGGVGIDLISPTWREWLGTVMARRLAEGNLRVFFHLPSDSPGTVDDVHAEVALRARLFLDALCLAGVAFHDMPIVLVGEARNGDLDVREVDPRLQPVWSEHFAAVRADEDALRSAYVIFREMLRLRDLGNTHFRFFGGLRALTRGLLETNTLDRTHQFVRALDGLIFLAAGQGRAKFAQRGPLFVSGIQDPQQFFLGLYNTRSSVEHLKPMSAFALEGETPVQTQNRLNQESSDIELLALNVYHRILNDRALLDLFEDDQSIAEFWTKSAAERQVIFGAPIDLVVLRQEREEAIFTQY